MIDSKLLAEYIIMDCNRKKIPISNMKLQKIVFYCQAYHIAYYGETLIDGHFEAWKHGAVLPSLYREYKVYKSDNILIYDEQRFHDLKNQFNEYLLSFLSKILTIFGEMSPSEIRRKNHSELPWLEARRGYAPNENCHEVINENTMYSFYSSLLKIEGVKCMKSKKMALQPDKLQQAKIRLAQRKLTQLDDSNKAEYYQLEYMDVLRGEKEIRRAINGSTEV